MTDVSFKSPSTCSGANDSEDCFQSATNKCNEGIDGGTMFKKGEDVKPWSIRSIFAMVACPNVGIVDRNCFMSALTTGVVLLSSIRRPILKVWLGVNEVVVISSC